MPTNMSSLSNFQLKIWRLERKIMGPVYLISVSFQVGHEFICSLEYLKLIHVTILWIPSFCGFFGKVKGDEKDEEMSGALLEVN